MAHELLGRDLRAKVSASDVVQETFLDALQSIRKRDADASPTRLCALPWLSRILKNNIGDMCKAYRYSKKRAIAREFPTHGNMKSSATAGTEEGFLYREQLEQVLKLIGHLPVAHQQFLKWRFLDELSYREIADRVSRSEDAIRMMIQRSLKRLALEMRIHDRSSFC